MPAGKMSVVLPESGFRLMARSRIKQASLISSGSCAVEKVDLAQMPLEELVSYHERVQKILDDRIAGEQADLDKRKAKLEKLMVRLAGKTVLVQSMPESSKSAKKATPRKGAKIAKVAKTPDMPKLADVASTLDAQTLPTLPKAPSFNTLLEMRAEEPAEPPAEPHDHPEAATPAASSGGDGSPAEAR
jgi:hypothetical protein